MVQPDLIQKLGKVSAVHRQSQGRPFLHQLLGDPAGIHSLGAAPGGGGDALGIPAVDVGHFRHPERGLYPRPNQKSQNGVLIPESLGELKVLKNLRLVDLGPGLAVEGERIGGTGCFVAVHNRLLVSGQVVRAPLRHIAALFISGGQQSLDGPGEQQVIGVHEHQIPSENLLQGHISGSGEAPVFLMNDLHPGIIGIPVRNGRGGIRGTVVHQNNTEIIFCLLRKDGIHALRQIIFHIVGGDNNLQVTGGGKDGVFPQGGSPGTGRGRLQHRPGSLFVHGGFFRAKRRRSNAGGLQGGFDQGFEHDRCLLKMGNCIVGRGYDPAAVCQ